MHEIWVVIAFGTIQFVAYIAEHKPHLFHNKFHFERIVRWHVVVWLAHPVILHTMQDYVIHFVVYSGRVLS